MSIAGYMVLAIATGLFAGSAGAIGENKESSPISGEQMQFAILDFDRAMHAWSRDMLGGLLFYYRSDGPLSQEIERQYWEADTDYAVPRTWQWRCLQCRSSKDCDATISVQFSDEDNPGLRAYRIIKSESSLWGLYSETRLEESASLAAELLSCQTAMGELLPRSQISVPIGDKPDPQCPEGYRLHYQGFCINKEDEQSSDPDMSPRTSEPR